MFNYLRPYLLWLAFVVQVYACSGQNIVPNGGFDDVNVCTEYKAACSPSAWFYIRKDGAYGYFPGDYHLTLLTANRKNTGRSYWETKLLCPLTPGEKYTIRVKVGANIVGPNLNDIGLYFTDSLVYTRSDTLLQPARYFSFLNGSAKSLQNYWFQVEKEFTATEAHQYLIVGNFSRQSNSDIYRRTNVQEDHMKMYVDDLEIIPESKHICEGAPRIKDSLYAIHGRHTTNGQVIVLDSLALLLKDAMADSDKVKREDTAVMKMMPKQVDTVTINNIQFEFNSYHLKDAAALDSMKAVFMRKDISGIRVAGFTDDVGSDTYNLSLSAKRAEEIRRLIMERFGIASSVISAEGKGISTSYADKSRNRRVEVYIYH